MSVLPGLELQGHDPLGVAEAWLDDGRAVAIATVIETWGSAPRPVGSQLVIDGDGNFEGSVSGGCVEGAVVAEAADVIADGTSRLLEFGVADETAWQVGLSCGGRIRVLVEAITLAESPLLSELNRLRRDRKAAVVVTGLAAGSARLVRESEAAADPLAGEILARLRSGKSGLVAAADGEAFLTVHLPPPRIVAIGAVHISQALAPMAAIAGFDLTIIDPRTAFATPERFADVALMPVWPEEALEAVPLDAFTALAALTHDPKIDDLPIARALAAGCFYVGALGSRKTHAKRLERLRAAGVPEADVGRIHAPIGLDIGAQSPAEIAVAILADMIAALRGRGLPA